MRKGNLAAGDLAAPVHGREGYVYGPERQTRLAKMTATMMGAVPARSATANQEVV
jgi:hypothetical protein